MADGAVRSHEEFREFASARAGFYGYDIYDQRPDNVEVFIQVGNGYFDPYLPHVDRATPPGSMSLWESVVESPAWRA